MSLRLAILKGDFHLSRHLIESGVDVNQRDGHGWTPLMLCSLHNGESWALGVARMLLAHGGRMGRTDAHGRCALTYAILHKRVSLVELLLQALDHDLMRVDNDGHSAYWYAVQTRDDAIHRLLMKKSKGLSDENSLCSKVVNTMKDLKPVERAALHTYKSDRHMNKTGVSVRPYKTLPANLWTSPKIYRGFRKGVQLGAKHDDVLGRNTKVQVKGAVGPASVQDWSLSLRKVTERLQDQLTLSYRPRAQPRPGDARTLRKLHRMGTVGLLGGSRDQRRQRGRKMSLGAIDDVQKMECRQKGGFRRRCSVAVIPMIRLQATCRQPSISQMESLKLTSTPRRKSETSKIHST